MKPSNAFRRNLEQFEEQTETAGWRMAGHVDLISERRYLVIKHKSDDIAGIAPKTIEVRCNTAHALAPQGCPAAIEIIQDDSKLEILTSYVKLLDAETVPHDEIETLFSQLLDTLAVFERYRFQAPQISPLTIGRCENGRAVVLPSAYALPPVSGNGTGSISRDAADHVTGLANIARAIVEKNSGARDSALLPRLEQTAEAVAAGKISSLNDFSLCLLERGIAADMLPYDSSPAPLRPGHATHLQNIATMTGDHRLVEIRGGARSGKSTTVGHLEGILSAAGRKASLVDEWDTLPRTRRRSGAGTAAGEFAVWLVDDVQNRSLMHAEMLEFVSADDDGDDRCLVYTVDGDQIDPATASFLQQLHSRADDSLVVVDLDGTGKTDRSAAHDRSDELSKLSLEELHLLQLLAVANTPLPLDLVLTVFSESGDDFLRGVHKLAGVNLIDLVYRSIPPANKTIITLATASASTRRIVLAGLAPERLINLHRTIARMAQTLPGFPGMFIYRHLLAGDEKKEAAACAVTFLESGTTEQRRIVMSSMTSELVDSGLLDYLSKSDQLSVLVQLGKDNFEMGHREEAERLLTLANLLEDQAHTNRRNAPVVCEGVRLLADTWSSRGQYSKALDLLRDARGELNPYLELPDQARLLTEIGWIQYRMGNYDSSIESCKMSLSTLNPREHPVLVAQALNLMGVIHFNTSRYDEAISYYEQSAFLREKENDQSGLAASYNNLALAYQSKAEYDKALNYYNKSLHIKKSQRNAPGIAAGYLNQALMFLEVHNFEEAEQKCHDSLKISTEIGMAQLTADNHCTLGDIRFRRGRLKDAEASYQKALALSRSLETANGEMGAQRRLATLYLATDRPEEARAAIEAAAPLAEQIGSRYESAQIESVLGDIDAAERDLAGAIHHYEKAASHYTTVVKYRLAAVELAKIGIAHSQNNNTIDAKYYLDRALDLIKSDIGHQIPDQIVTLQQTLRETPLQPSVSGANSEKLTYAFYELSSLFEYADDKPAFFKRLVGVLRDLSDCVSCTLALKSDGGFVLVRDDGEQEPLIDHSLLAIVARSLQTGSLLHSLSPEMSDLVGARETPGWHEMVVLPMKSMGYDLGCAVFSCPTSRLPLAKEDINFLTSVGKHIAGSLRLAYSLEESAHKEETLEHEFETLKAQVEGQYHLRNLIGKDEPMKKIFRTIEKIQDMDTGILIIGESGTGKTELARAIHYNSLRRRRRFQQIHCAEIPITLLESELFGHEKGAFTGASQRKLGRCEIADGGTIFLDDVNVMPHETQSKLLHYLENKSFTRLGGTQKIKTDVRIIAASNEDLEALVKEGRFREDLFYRLKVILLELPPLRERREDMIIIAQEFLKKRCSTQNKPLKTLSTETIKLFQKYRWPGNVRELQNILEQVVLLSDENIIEPSSLPEDFLKKTAGPLDRRRQTLEALVQQIVECDDYSEANPLMPQIEAVLAKKMAGQVDNKNKAARLLGITKPTLYNRLRGYDKLVNPEEMRKRS